MSMNEFEKPDHGTEEKFPFHSLQRYNCPYDFSEDDFAFAEELNALFPTEIEELPPYYVPTLLASDDQRFEPVGRGFEHRTSAHVFRRLKLRRHLFNAHAFPPSTLSLSNTPTRRSLLALCMIFLCVMLLTVTFTGAAFASGAALLLHGTHGSGVEPVPHLPPLAMVRSPLDGKQSRFNTDQEVSLQAVQQQMHFPIYWPQDQPSSYALNQINLYTDVNQQWADGPMLEFEYELPVAVAPKGTGEIWVREFKPKADVLQLVKEGASVPIQMDDNGRAWAIYVDGQWDMRGRNPPVWVYGQRSELVYQLNGVVFWIVGDQRDGIGEQQLVQIAQGLASGALNRQFRMMGDAISVQQLSQDVPGPFSNDIVAVFPEDGGNGPYYMNVSSYKPPKNVH
jgi:hypothetical protein